MYDTTLELNGKLQKVAVSFVIVFVIPILVGVAMVIRMIVKWVVNRSSDDDKNV